MFDSKIPNNDMRKMPLALDFRDPDLLIQLSRTNAEIATLNEVAKTIPNQNILLEFLSIKEAVNSNEVENINTTISDAFQAELEENKKRIKKEDKETLHYKDALKFGLQKIKENGCLVTNDYIEMNSILLEHTGGIYSSPEKRIMKGSEVIYTPPQGYDLLVELLKNYEYEYNTFQEDQIDPLLKLPMLHYQFEAIHPFMDGNGRTGRILIALYLVLNKKLELPILFLSEYILQNKKEYTDGLNAIDRQEKNSLKHFTLWMLLLIQIQALKTQKTILKIKKLMTKLKDQMRANDKIKKLYSHELLNYLFERPYYVIGGLEKKLGVHRNTATTYLQLLEEEGILKSFKNKRKKIYIYPEFLFTLDGK